MAVPPALRQRLERHLPGADDADEAFLRSVRANLDPVDEAALVDLLGFEKLGVVMELIADRKDLLDETKLPPPPVYRPLPQAVRGHDVFPTDAPAEPAVNAAGYRLPTTAVTPELRALNREAFERATPAHFRETGRPVRPPRRVADQPAPEPKGPVTSSQLFDAAESGRAAQVAQLGARLKRQDAKSQALRDGGLGPDGWTGPMRAALFGFAPALRELLKLGADVSRQNAYGQTALELAVLHHRQDCVQVLLAHGAARHLHLHQFAAVRHAVKRGVPNLLGLDAIQKLCEHDEEVRRKLEEQLDAAEEKEQQLVAERQEQERQQALAEETERQLRAQLQACAQPASPSHLQARLAGQMAGLGRKSCEAEAKARALEAEKQEHAEAAAAALGQAQALEQQLADLRAALQATTQAASEARQQQRAHEQQLGEEHKLLEQQLEEQLEQQLEEHKLLEEQLEQQLEQQRAAHERDLARAKQSHAAKLEELAAEHARTLEEQQQVLEEAHAAKLAEQADALLEGSGDQELSQAQLASALSELDKAQEERANLQRVCEVQDAQLQMASQAVSVLEDQLRGERAQLAGALAKQEQAEVALEEQAAERAVEAAKRAAQEQQAAERDVLEIAALRNELFMQRQQHAQELEAAEQRCALGREAQTAAEQQLLPLKQALQSVHEELEAERQAKAQPSDLAERQLAQAAMALRVARAEEQAAQLGKEEAEDQQKKTQAELQASQKEKAVLRKQAAEAQRREQLAKTELKQAQEAAEQAQTKAQALAAREATRKQAEACAAAKAKAKEAKDAGWPHVEPEPQEFYIGKEENGKDEEWEWC